MAVEKLVYWKIHGRALPIRLAALIGKYPLEDEFISFQEFQQLKETYPFGGLPVLKTEHGVISQSNAILVYIGKQTGLYPADRVAAARVDELLGFAEDVTNAIAPSIRESDPEKKAAMREKLRTEAFPKYFGYLQRYHASVGSPKYLTSNELTVADLKFFAVFNWISSGKLDGIPTDTLSAYPALSGVVAAVLENEAVKNHLANCGF
jgi:glutathione S-transferase